MIQCRQQKLNRNLSVREACAFLVDIPSSQSSPCFSKTSKTTSKTLKSVSRGETRCRMECHTCTKTWFHVSNFVTMSATTYMYYTCLTLHYSLAKTCESLLQHRCHLIVSTVHLASLRDFIRIRNRNSWENYIRCNKNVKGPTNPSFCSIFFTLLATFFSFVRRI